MEVYEMIGGTSSDRTLRQRATSFGTIVSVATMERIESENVSLHEKVDRLQEMIQELNREAKRDQETIGKLDNEITNIKRAYTAVAPGIG